MNLAEIHTNFDQLLTRSLDPVVVLDLEYQIVAVNQAFQVLVGLKKEDMIAKNFQQIFISTDLQNEVEEIRSKVLSGQIIQLKTKRLHADGHLIPVRLTAYPIIYETVPIGICGVYIDLSELVNFEKKILESENLLRNFANAVPDMSLIVNEDGTYVEVFGDTQKVLAKAKNEMVGKNIQDVFPPEIAEKFVQVTQETIASGMSQFVVREMEIDGALRIAEERLVPLCYIVNGRKTMGVIVTDITDRQQLERRLFFAYELHRRSDLLNSIIFENPTMAETLETYSRKLGIDFSIPMFCCLLRSESYANTWIGKPQYHQRRDLKYALMDWLGNDSEHLVWDIRSDIGILCKAQNANHEALNFEAIVERLIGKLQAFDQDLQVTIGVSNVFSGSEGIKKSYRQALSAIAATYCHESNEARIQSSYYNELGLLKFLLNYSEEKYVDEFIAETIGKLIENDLRKGTNLLGTLEAIVKNFTLQATAVEMYLHPKTVLYRKKQIEKILEYSLDNIDRRYAAALAICLYKIRNNVSEKDRGTSNESL